MKNTYEEAVQKTVNFWSEKSFGNGLNQNNGDDTEAGLMTFLLMNLVSNNAKESITDDKILEFEIKLTELLMNCSVHERTLDVDYAPCRFLYEAAKHAGIDGGCFPCKTFTRINKDNSVSAKYQYGGEHIKL